MEEKSQEYDLKNPPKMSRDIAWDGWDNHEIWKTEKQENREWNNQMHLLYNQ